MLKLLRIHNLILIESAEIHFSGGFNVLSGETGSGKSAILSALALLTGERADTSLIRRGEEKGVVEAAFDIEKQPEILALLNKAGLDHEAGSELLIRREMAFNEKNRCFVNNQLVQMKVLREISAFLLEIVGQHANQVLLSIEKHGTLVDLFGGLEKEVNDFKIQWQSENRLSNELEKLINQESQRLREIEVCRMELEELEEAQLKEGEDEALFAEYTLLTNAQERADKVNAILNALNGEKQSILSLLSRHKNTFEELLKLDSHFTDTAKAYEAATIELQEIAYTLRTARLQIEHQPEKAAAINERLTLIARLKRKYGHSIEEILTYQTQARKKLEELERADIHIEEIKEKLIEIRKQNEEAAAQLTKKRTRAARALEKALTQELRALNMPKAEFYVDIASQKRSERGDDRMEFFFAPNAGEHRIPIKECASGGELSRILLALQTLLAEKAQISTLVFDEIDSNIGGTTARIVGKKLRELGAYYQVLCITHFAQVAQEAEHHIQISKVEKEGRTVTQVHTLQTEDREKELARMVGTPLAY